MRGKTSIAAEVIEVSGAINELLLRVSIQATIFDQVGTLEASNCGESPAGAALALVLDGADTAVALPVPGIRSITVSVGGQRRGASS